MSRWPIVKLGQVAEFINGDRGKNYPSGSDFVDNGIPFINAGHLVNGTVDFSRMNYISESLYSLLNSGKTRQNDILYCLRGSLGKTAIVRTYEDAAIASSLVIIRPSNECNVGYLYHFLTSPLCNAELSKFYNGSSQPNLSATNVKNYRLPLPPLPEQKRIAAILDKADSIRRKRQEAVRLTEELLRSVFLDMFGDPVTNPKGWETCCLGEVVQKIESGWSPVCDEGQAEENEWGVLKLGAVTTCRYLDTESKALPAGISARPDLEVKAGDLLFTRKNTYDLVAASALVYATRPKLMLSDLIFRLKLKDDSAVISEYLWALLSSTGKRKQIQSLAGGSAGSMPNISKSKLMEQMIEVPPIALQLKYAKILHSNYRIRNMLEVSEQASDILFNSLLKQAFRGELQKEAKGDNHV